MGKKTRGRQKIDIVKIQNQQNLHVTFSRRRTGILKKASEICCLTGSEVVLVIFSPGGKAYSFGCPSVEAVIHRFESQTPVPVDPSHRLLEAHQKVSVQNLNNQFPVLESQLEAKKKIGKTLEQQSGVGQIHHWWEAPVDKLNLEQLEQLQLALLELQRRVKGELKKPKINGLGNHNPSLKGMDPYGMNQFGVNAMDNGLGVSDLSRSKPSSIRAFTPGAVPSRINADSSTKDGTVASAEGSGQTSVSLSPNLSEPAIAARLPQASQGFNSGHGGFSWL